MRPLPPGQCDDTPTFMVAPSYTGTFQLHAIVDEGNAVPELVETNNGFTGPLIRFGDGPDLIVTSISGPPSVSGPFTIVATVCNQGTQSSGGTVSYYASFDPIITGSGDSPLPDYLLDARWVDVLAPGQCATELIDAFQVPGEGRSTSARSCKRTRASS